jgi:carboxyl-terminal processing protease
VLTRRPLLRRAGLIAGLVLLVAVSFGAGIYVDQSYPDAVPVFGGQGSQVDAASIEAVGRLIRANYYDPHVSGAQLGQNSIQGMVQGLHDPYTRYLTPAQYKDQQNAYAGRYTGIIGIYVVFSGQRPVIAGVVPGSPAQAAGLHDGDVILAIGGTDTTGMTTDKASALIRGPAGTVVTLRVQRSGGQLTIRVKRATFTSPTVQSTKLAGGVLYLRIYEFGDNTQKEFDQQLKAGLAGSRAVVLDLRDNGGGFVSAATAVISRFVVSGEAFETRGRNQTERTNVDGNHPAGGLPVVVLVNGGTASASEIVAGSLQAHHRARLVGTKTYGKGSVQVDYPLPDGGDLHLTIQHWYLPNGHSIDHTGLTPDDQVSLPDSTGMFDVVEPGRGHAADTQLNSALQLLGQ